MSLEIYTVYENPTDYPGKFVVRKFVLDKPTDWVKVADTLPEARATMPLGLFGMPRDPSDDPKIIETWF